MQNVRQLLLRQVQPFTECFKLFSGHFAAQIQGGAASYLSSSFLVVSHSRSRNIPVFGADILPARRLPLLLSTSAQNLGDPEAVFSLRSLAFAAFGGLFQSYFGRRRS